MKRGILLCSRHLCKPSHCAWYRVYLLKICTTMAAVLWIESNHWSALGRGVFGTLCTAGGLYLILPHIHNYSLRVTMTSFIIIMINMAYYIPNKINLIYSCSTWNRIINERGVNVCTQACIYRNENNDVCNCENGRWKTSIICNLHRSLQLQATDMITLGYETRILY